MPFPDRDIGEKKEQEPEERQELKLTPSLRNKTLPTNPQPEPSQLAAKNSLFQIQKRLPQPLKNSNGVLTNN